MKLYAAAGFTTICFGSGRPEFNPKKPMPTFDRYLQETAKGTCDQLIDPDFDEGIIGSFMSGRFINQANLPGFLPFMTPSLRYKPCTAVEGACGTGGRAIAMAARSVLSGMADSVFVAGFEMQNTMKAVYGADVLAGAAYYAKERKDGQAFFFPGIFSERAGAYYEAYGYEQARYGMAEWYEQMIYNARRCPKAQEHYNTSPNLYDLALQLPNPKQFVPYLNRYDCSKNSDGAASLVIANERGLSRLGLDLKNALEIVAFGEAEDDITLPPSDLTALSTTKLAVAKAFEKAGIRKEDLGILELHDCFTITALLALEAIGFAEPGHGAQFILRGRTAPDGIIPTNLSGGLGGFGHPTGATGVRQLVDLLHQFTGKASNQISIRKPYGLMISMGGNDKTVTAIVVKGVER